MCSAQAHVCFGPIADIRHGSVLIKTESPFAAVSLRKFHHALIKRPRAGLGVLAVLVEGGRVSVRPFSPIKSVIQANQNSSLGRFGVEGADDAATCRVQCPISRAEVHVISFQKRRPLRGEHPFDAAADRPTCSGLGGLANLKTIEGDVCTGMTPGRAAHTGAFEIGRCSFVLGN